MGVFYSIIKLIQKPAVWFIFLIAIVSIGVPSIVQAQDSTSSSIVASGLGIAFDEIFRSFAGLVVILQEIITGFAIFSIEVFYFIVNNITTTTIIPSAIFILWDLLKSFISMFFILIFVIMAYATIFKKKEYSFTALLPSLIAVAILLNFTYIIPFQVSAIGDQLSSAFAKPIQGSLKDTTVSTLLMDNKLVTGGNTVKTLDFIENNKGTIKTVADFVKLVQLPGVGLINNYFIDKGLESVGINSTTESPSVLVSRGLSFILISLIILVVFVILSIFFILRVFVIWLLVITAPIALFAYIIPKTRPYFNQWLSELVSWSFFPAVYLLCLYFGLAIMNLRSSFNNASTPISLGTYGLGITIADIIFYIFSLVFFIGALIAAKTVAKELGIATPKGFSYLEDKIGLKSILENAEQRKVGGTLNAIFDKTVARIPGVRPYYQGLKQGVQQRVDNTKQRITTRIQSGLGRFSAQQGQVTQEQFAARIGGRTGLSATSDAAKAKQAAELANKEKTRIQALLDQTPLALRQKKLDELRKDTNTSTANAAELINLDNRLALGERIGVDEYAKLARQFGGEKTDLGKEFLKTVNGKLDIEKDLKTRAETLLKNDPAFLVADADGKKKLLDIKINELKQGIALGSDPNTKDLKELRRKVSEDLVKNGKIQVEKSEVEDKENNDRKTVINQLASTLYTDSEKLKFLDNVKLGEIFKLDDGRLDKAGLARFATKELDANAPEFEKQLQKKAIKESLEKGYFVQNIGDKNADGNEIKNLEDQTSANAKALKTMLDKFTDKDERREALKSLDIKKIFRTEEERLSALNNVEVKDQVLEKLVESMSDKEINSVSALNTALARLGGAKKADEFNDRNKIATGRATEKGDNIIRKFNFKTNFKTTNDVKKLVGAGKSLEALELELGTVFTSNLIDHLSENTKILDKELTDKVLKYYKDTIGAAQDNKKAQLQKDLDDFKKEINKSNPLLTLNPDINATDRSNKIKDILVGGSDISKYSESFFQDTDVIHEAMDIMKSSDIPDEEKRTLIKNIRGPAKKAILLAPELNKLKEIKKKYEEEIENIKQDIPRKIEELKEAKKLVASSPFNNQAKDKVKELEDLGLNTNDSADTFIQSQIDKLNATELYKNIDIRIDTQQKKIEDLTSPT